MKTAYAAKENQDKEIERAKEKITDAAERLGGKRKEYLKDMLMKEVRHEAEKEHGAKEHVEEVIASQVVIKVKGKKGKHHHKEEEVDPMQVDTEELGFLYGMFAQDE